MYANILQNAISLSLAFKFRVVSEATGECFPISDSDPEIVTTQGTTTTLPTTTQPTTDTTHATSTQAKEETTSTSNTPPMETTHFPASTTSTASAQTSSTAPMTSLMTSSSETDHVQSTWAPSSEKSTTTDRDVNENHFRTTASSMEQPETTTQALDAMSSTPSNKARPKPTRTNNVEPDTRASTNPANTTENAPSAGRRRRACDMMVYHQDIKIVRKKIYKGCDGIRQMKRVKEMDKKFLSSTIRLRTWKCCSHFSISFLSLI